MASRRLLIPAATAIVVVVIATGAGIVVSHDRSGGSGVKRPSLGSPKLPALSINGGPGGVTEAAIGTAQLGAPRAGKSQLGAPQLGAPQPADKPAGKIAAPIVGGTQIVTIKGDLPTATDALVPAYTLTRRTLTREDVVRLAAILGLKGEPKSQAGGWQLSDGAQYLSIAPTPTLDWRFMPADVGCTSGGGASGGGGVAVGSPGSPGAAGTASGNEGPPAPAIGVDPKATQATTEDPATPNTKPTESSKGTESVPPVDAGGPAVTPIPAPCAGTAVSSGVACAAPADGDPQTVCPTQPAKPVATDDKARASAIELLKKLGITAEEGDIRTHQGYDGVRHVSVARRVEGREATGLLLQIDVDVAGTVVSASGQLAEPAAAGAYPMLPPAELAQSLASRRMMTMLCRQEPGVDGCAPPPPIVVTGASIGLSLVYPADFEKGEAYLLPAWLFTIEGDPQPTAIVAVPDKYRTDPQPLPGKDIGPKTGTIEPAPMPPAVDQGQPRQGAAAPAVATPTLAIFYSKLPTSDWDGQSAMAAKIEGTLTNVQGCLSVVSVAGKEPTPLLWPPRYTSADDGTKVVVSSDDGKVVARTGERFSAGGGYANASTHTRGEDSPCKFTNAWVINSRGPYTR